MSQLDPAAVTSVAHFRSSLSTAPLEQQEKNKLCEEQRHRGARQSSEAQKDSACSRNRKRSADRKGQEEAEEVDSPTGKGSMDYGN